jgi:hypothetical protein
MRSLVVPQRFCGPRNSGNGGWSSGALAELVEGCPRDHTDPWPTVEVSLLLPPPLDVPLGVSAADGVTVLARDNATRVGEARILRRELATVPPVPAEEARAAEASYAGLTSHPFPTCFTCGTQREPGDGLRIFPGQVNADPRRVAATWTPHPSVAEDYHAYHDDVPRASLPVTWAALDCVGGWASDMAERLAVLGRMTTQVDALPAIGEEHVVVGELRDAQGRKSFTSATMYDASGALVARAEHIWIAVDPAKFN